MDKQDDQKIWTDAPDAEHRALDAGIAYGAHLRHVLGHRGDAPLDLDQWGRCIVCVAQGFRCDA